MFGKRGLDNQSSPELVMYSQKVANRSTLDRPITARSAPPLADESPKFAKSVDCKLTIPSVAVAPLYNHRNVTSAPGYPSGNIAVNSTTANRGKGWPKQKPQAARTHHNSIFSMHDKTGTTPTCRKYTKTSREKHSQPLPVKTYFDYFQ